MTTIGEVELVVIPMGDSYTAYSANGNGAIIPSCGVAAPGWTALRFYRMPKGQCGTGALWNGWQLGIGADYVSGYTVDGVLRDRLHLAGITKDRTTLVPAAIGGTTAAQWAVFPGEVGYSGKWDAIDPVLDSPPAGKRVLLTGTFGANDILRVADQTPFAATSVWNAAAADLRANIIRILDRVFTKCPDAEMILPGYVNFWADDAPLVPGGPGNVDCSLGPCTRPYPPTSNLGPIHRAVLSTASFGFARQSLGFGDFNGVDLVDTWNALSDARYIVLYGAPVNRSDPRWGVIHDSGPPFCLACYNPTLWQLSGLSWPGYAKNTVDDGAFRNIRDDTINTFFKGIIDPILRDMEVMFPRAYYVPEMWNLFTWPGHGYYGSARTKNTSSTDGTFADFVHLSYPATQAYCDHEIASWLARTTFLDDYFSNVNFGAGDAVSHFEQQFAIDSDDEPQWDNVEAIDYIRKVPRRGNRPIYQPPSWA